jgi:uncharacterized damage-inducible protein DinB
MLKQQFQRFSRYNRWANRRLYDACARLSAVDYHAARPAFFGSIHGTLNHILVADRIWQARMAGEAQPGLALDTELYRDLPALTRAREEEDEAIIALVEAQQEADLGRVIEYRTTSGEPQATPALTILQHLFNHQTHHRGQVHGMLSATAVPPPPLDLAFFVRTPEERSSR